MYAPFSIKFYLRVQNELGPKFKIYCRVILNRKKSEFATNLKVEEKYWYADSETTRFSYMNEEIADLRMKLYKIKRSLEDEEKLYHPRDIIDVLKNRKKENHYILAYFGKYIKRITVREEHSQSTLKHYRLAFKYLEKFINEQLLRDDVMIRELNYDMLNEYDYYLKVVVLDKQKNNLGRNHINKQHSILRTVLKHCMKEGIIEVNPYNHMQLKDTKVKREALTVSELTLLENDPLDGSPQLDLVRDIFLFSAYTSLRFGDAMALKLEDIEDWDTSTPFIKITFEKTDETIAIPLISKAIEIIKKYDDNAARVVLGHILPRLSNSKVNLYLKDIAVKLGIKKRLIHHLARHTFATNALNLGIPKEVVQSVLGHTDMKTTDIYAKMSIAKKSEEMKKLE